MRFGMNSMNKPYGNTMRKRILKIYGWILSIGLFYWLWIQLTDLAIPCLYLLTTGLRCPGCGVSRMLLALFRLDFAAAFDYNPVMFVMFFLWNLVALLCFWGKPSWIQQPKFLYVLFWISLTISIVFGLMRNFT